MAASNQIGSKDLFDAYFRRADLDGDGHISGAEAVAFFQGSNLPKHVLAQVWAYADSKKSGYLGRAEFYNSLKLVTVAQSKRELTPDIVKAALYGPASAKIPAPQINLAATPSPQPRAVTPATQAGGIGSATSQTTGMGGSNLSGNSGSNQQYIPQQNQFVRPPRTTAPTGSSHLLQNFPSQGTVTGVTMPSSRPTNLPMSSDWLSGQKSGPAGQGNSHVSNQLINQSSNQNVLNHAGSGLTSPLQPKPQVTSVMPPKPQDSAITPKPQDAVVPSTRPADKDSNALAVSGNGFPSDSLFGDVFSATPTETKQSSSGATSSASSSSVSTRTVVASDGAQASFKQTPGVSVQSTFRQHPVGGLNQHGQSTGRPSQQFAPSSTASGSAGSHVGVANSATNQFTQPQQLPWRKMTPADVLKYTKVFMQVDSDRDGKITGHQARNLFLSWKLPREVLKHIWDLSDQDNDSMLSLREFCIALYLMEYHREGRPLPPHLPSTILPNENLFSTPGQPVAPSWGPTHGFQNQQQVPSASRPPGIPRGKPPRPVLVSYSEGAVQPTQQKRKVPVLEKHLVDQLSKEEQESLNSKFQDATAVDKKVEELEKEIVESKQKVEFYRVKMQELVLYKSRCDNRFNEITERVSADKHEVESLAKKYEEKYKQSGDVASKLSIEEATFRDIQEKKMEMYQAIVKFEEGNPDDGLIKEQGEHVKSGLEELVKNLNERCKQYGLRGKPTSLVELPFGWQAGIQEAAADWDEDWDKLEDEGFTFVKELTLNVQNVIASPKERSSANKKEADSSVKKESDISLSNTDAKEENVPSTGEQVAGKGPASEQSDAKAPDTPARRNAEENQSQKDSNPAKSNDIDGSPRSKDTRSDHGHDGDKSTHFGEKSFDEPRWGKLDTDFDTDSVSGFSDSGKDHEKHDSGFGFGFGFEEFSIKPIKTSSTDTGIKFPGKPSLFADSVPSTPADAVNIFPGKKSFFDDSVPSTPAYAGNIFPEKKSFFDDSVPSTPAYGGMAFPEKKSFFDDSVPSTPAYNSSDFGSKPFASVMTPTDDIFPGQSPFMLDSVPSTPAHKLSEDYSFDSLSRFDSFNMHSNGFSLSRFDSLRSTSEPDPFASRFDSFNSQRFDSLSSQRFDSFSAHGFGSSNNTNESGFSQSPRNSLARFDSIRSTSDSDYGHGSGFDDSEPFGSSGPFKTSTESQTRRSSEHWNAF